MTDLKSNSANLHNNRVYDPSVSHSSYFTTYVQRNFPEILKYCNCMDPDRLLFHQVHSFIGIGYRGQAVVLKNRGIAIEEFGATGHAVALENDDIAAEEFAAKGQELGQELATAGCRRTHNSKWESMFSELQKHYAI